MQDIIIPSLADRHEARMKKLRDEANLPADRFIPKDVTADKILANESLRRGLVCRYGSAAVDARLGKAPAPVIAPVAPSEVVEEKKNKTTRLRSATGHSTFRNPNRLPKLQEFPPSVMRPRRKGAAAIS